MFVYYINVPLNEEGIKEFETYDEKMLNVKTFELTQAEYETLRQPNGLFQKFDEKFGTIIDVCEEERIEKTNLSEALQYVNKLLAKHKNELTDNALEKVAESLNCAINAGTFWEIDIYLEPSILP